MLQVFSRLFPYGAYVSCKNDTPTLTQICSGLLKDWWTICLSHVLVVQWKATSRLFSGNLNN